MSSSLLSYLKSIPQVKASAIPLRIDDFEAMISEQVNLHDEVAWGFCMKYKAYGAERFDHDVSSLELIGKRKIYTTVVLNQSISGKI